MSIKFYPHEYHQLLIKVEEFERNMIEFLMDYIEDFKYFGAYRDMSNLLISITKLNHTLKEYILLKDESAEFAIGVKENLKTVEENFEELSFKILDVDGRILKENLSLWKMYENLINDLSAKSDFNDLWYLDLGYILEVIDYRRERWNMFTETEAEDF